MIFFKKRFCFLIICNDLFSRFEQQILFLEKQAEATDPTTDRHGHDGPSQGLVSKHLEKLKIGYWNRLSELRNGMAGGTVTDSSEKLSLWTLWQAAERTVAGATGRHRLRNPSLGQISWYVLRDVFDYSCLNYKVSGLMLISLITWGLKEVTLS